MNDSNSLGSDNEGSEEKDTDVDCGWGIPEHDYSFLNEVSDEN